MYEDDEFYKNKLLIRRVLVILSKRPNIRNIMFSMFSYKMIDVLLPLLCTWQAKWAERPAKVKKRRQRWSTLQISPHRDSNSCGSDLWSNALPTRSMFSHKQNLRIFHNIGKCNVNNNFSTRIIERTTMTYLRRY
jgi:hypothetical protein